MVIDEKTPSMTRLPVLAIALGLAQAVIGGAAVFPLAWCCIFTVWQWYKLSHLQFSQVLPSFKWYTLSVWPAMFLAICAFASGLGLLHRNPRGRYWTLVLAGMGIVYGSCQITARLVVPLSETTFAANPHIWWYYAGGLIAYCLIAIIIMSLPNVKRAYAVDNTGLDEQ